MLIAASPYPSSKVRLVEALVEPMFKKSRTPYCNTTFPKLVVIPSRVRPTSK